MRIDGRRAHTSATWMLRRGRRRRTVILRSLTLGLAVFTLAAITGALLAGSAPSNPAEVPAEVSDYSAAEPARHAAHEQAFARSMILSGTAALTVSVTGLVMVGRRRRRW